VALIDELTVSSICSIDLTMRGEEKKTRDSSKTINKTNAD